MLIAKILNKEQFVVNTVEPNYHILFEAAIEMNMFHDMHRLLTRFNGTHLEALKETILQFYDILLSCSHYNLFLKEEFLVPMMFTLNFCSHYSPVRVENILLQTLHSICVALRQQIQSPSSKFDLFWSVCLNPSQYVQRLHRENSEDDISSPTRMSQYSADKMHSLCDLLVNYVHRGGNLCWLSRDSLLLLAASSASNESAGYHIANDSNLCEVLATDMVVLFTNIPRQLVDSDSIDDWPKLLSEIEDQMLKDHPLEQFLDHYEFCCSIVDMSNSIVKENMLACLYKGFLLPVLAPEIQSTSKPELATTTVYLDRILLKSKESILLPFLLRFLFSDRNATHSGGLTPQSFKHEITQALEQSFPLSESSLLRGSSEFASAVNQNSYVHLFFTRFEASNTLVSLTDIFLFFSANTYLSYITC
ncbi:unnamed protein product [Hymenolepis diminuta]|uniref:Protein dopey-1 n=1 Tax=Hymenolepis diminuta TaxID=6216 RepID=A0A0R3SW46_HYMDI|nr:unnamed protein product [Hymenolepis diminuta]